MRHAARTSYISFLIQRYDRTDIIIAYGRSSDKRPRVTSLSVGSPLTGFHQPGSGVVLSCLDCFIGTGSFYFFQYGTNACVSISRLRSGTCTIAKSDPPQDVIHRAMYLLQNGFGNYSLVLNNCENFALYCKTSLLCSKWDNAGSSGQVNGWVMSPLNVIVSSAVKIARCSTPVAAVVLVFERMLLRSTWRIWHCSESEKGEEVICGR
ncbi:LRAT-like domain-containing protein [Tanacetum coccineum]